MGRNNAVVLTKPDQAGVNLIGARGHREAWWVVVGKRSSQCHDYRKERKTSTGDRNDHKLPQNTHTKRELLSVLGA